ncbi:hypothetical protein [Alkalibacterium sp. 20]|uniref:hypothetical protein n=1 Tax=Alkalibacterium sp. 20 TaxID=1798803 RepID=UPI0009002DA3|nr:hypothetical protein [Alkalibacterium sp. 20]OJF96168.1 hypothetical protein AX762_05395 [Alkalibacterium sp. 20]
MLKIEEYRAKFSEHLQIAESLSDVLSDRSYIVCRRKLIEHNGPYIKEGREFTFCTFHSLAYSVLPKETIEKPNMKNTMHMFNLVKEAHKAALGYVENDLTVIGYHYKAIRLYENTLDKERCFDKLFAGIEVYQEYKKLLKGKLDWENSIQLAKYYLEDNLIDSIRSEASNLIIIGSESVSNDSNSNIKEFLKQFGQWHLRNHKDLNIFLLKNNKDLISIVNGIELPTVNVFEAINQFSDLNGDLF